MELRIGMLRGLCLAIAAAAMSSLPTLAEADDCSCLPRCRLFSRGCNDCCDSNGYEAAMTDGAAAGDPNTPFDLGEGAPAQSGNQFAILENPGGYIDSAIVGNQFRMRFDAAYGNPIPDRAEFFYAQCGCFNGVPVANFAPGPPGNPNTNVDYQEFMPYLERAFSDRFSVFAETPIRLINPDVSQNAGGWGDINAGFKYAFIAHPCEYLTAQLRVYTPTGQPELGLGNGHFTIEPSILYFRRFDENWTLQAELRDWIPISNSVTPTGENFAGNVVRYGVGLGYDIWLCCDQCESRRITPVAEVVGWSILDGFGLDPALGVPVDQSGVTIVNAKFGARYTVNEHSLYAGYGVPVTNDVWYDGVFRMEYRRAF